MGLETATKIHELNPNNPASTDPVGKGDDHIRVIKTAVQGSFPNFGAASDSGVVTLDADTINGLTTADDQQDTDRDAVVTELLKHVIPVGAITLWSGTVPAIPTGWALCDGTGGTNNLGNAYTTPDLRGVFVSGAGGALNPGDTGGASTDVSTAAGGHDHGGSVSAVALTEAQMPVHDHLLFNDTENTGGSGDPLPTANQFVTGSGRRGGTDRQYVVMSSVGGAANIGKSSEAGSGATHTHTITSEADHTHTVNIIPPYYALAYIQKVDEYDDPLAP